LGFAVCFSSQYLFSTEARAEIFSRELVMLKYVLISVVFAFAIMSTNLAVGQSARNAGITQLPGGWVRAQLSGSDLQHGNLFGFSVATSTDTVVVASRAFDCVEGGAYVFVKPTAGWGNTMQTAKLTGSDWGPCGGSGFDEVAISGDVIVAGAGPTGQTAYVFVKPPGGWKDMTETARLTTNPSLFGIFSLAISGRTIAAGYTNGLGNELGALAVFVESANGWKDMTQTAILSASDGASGDQLGWSVAVDRDTIIAGAPYAKVNNTTWAGAVYVFAEPAAGWADATQTAKLTSLPGSGQGNLGSANAISAGTVVSGTQFGDADIFVKSASGWADSTAIATITGPASAPGFASSTAISGDVIAVGAPNYPNRKSYGAVFVFKEPATGWQTTSTPSAVFSGSPAGGTEEVGYSLSANGSTLVAGAALFNDESGTAYLLAPK
jgi:FG-GAP repeat